MTLVPAQITILGSGTSTGVPVPGCSCPICQSTHPKNQRLRTSCLVATSSGNTIIDTGPDFRQQVLREKVGGIDSVLFTHDHADHTAGIDDLRGFCYLRSAPIPCYTYALAAQELRRRFSYIFRPDPEYLGAPVPQLHLREVQWGETFASAGVVWTALELLHGKLPVMGFRSGSFAYCTDCNHIAATTRESLQGVETLVITGLRFEPHATHFTIPQAIETAQSLGVKRTVLIHMTHSIDYEEVSAQLPTGAELAYDGMRLQVQVTGISGSEA